MSISSEMFRFVLVRPPQPVKDNKDTAKVDLEDTGDSTGLKDKLKEACKSDKKETDVRQAVDNFKKTGDYLSDKGQIQTGILSFFLWIQQAEPKNLEDLEGGIQKVFGVPDSATLIKTDTYRQDCQRVTDSFISAYLIRDRDAKNFNFLTKAYRICQLIRRMANGDKSLNTKAGIEKTLVGSIVFPKLLPPAMMLQRPSSHEDLLEEKKTAKERIQILDREISELEAAIEDLNKLKADDFTSEPPPVTKLGKRSVYNGLIQRSFRYFGIAPKGESLPRSESLAAELPSAQVGKKVWTINNKGKAKLDPQTLVTIEALNMKVDSDSVFDISEAMEMTIAHKAKSKVGEADYVATTRLRRFGPLIIRHKDDPDDYEPPVSPEPLDIPEPQAPAVQAVGVADLLQVTQSIQKYTFGEVAHIENVVGGETKVRSHRRLDNTEESFFVEKEESEESSRELETAERFELQRESEKVIEQDMTLEAGLSITASYGPTVSVTADVGFGLTRSKSESQRTASNHARNVTERASKNIQKRVLERRSRSTLREVEEINKHTLENKKTDHIAAIYQWVDKLYKAETINYGSRLLFDFLLPEPAAFTHYVNGKVPVEGIVVDKPLPPTYKNNQGKKVPLAPKHISPSNYQKWLTQYQVQGIEPPPQSYRIASNSYKTQTEQSWIDRKVDRVADKIVIPEGYYPFRSFVRASIYPSSSVTGHAYVAIGQAPIVKRINFNENEPDWTYEDYVDHPLSEWLENEDGVPVTIFLSQGMGGAVTVEVMCKRANKALEKWQIETYNQIMQAYQDLKSQYDDQVAAQMVAQGVAISGRNPEQNRELEKTELKKGVVSVLRGKHPNFNAIEESTDYPRINLGNYRSQGEIIQFFENAFEWAQMTYVFYPYFWARNELWPEFQQLEDVDPLHAQFLRAGAARVVLPVRPGFEEPVLHYLDHPDRPENDRIWNGSTKRPDVTSEHYLPIWEEIKSLQSGTRGKSIGTLTVNKDSVEITGNQSGYSVGTLIVKKDSINVSGNETSFTDDDVGREIIIEGVSCRIEKIISENEILLCEPYKGEDNENARYIVVFIFDHDDVDREIVIETVSYRIANVISTTKLELNEPYRGQDKSRARYAIGGKFVGPPWEVKVPTSLVHLNRKDELPDWKTEP